MKVELKGLSIGLNVGAQRETSCAIHIIFPYTSGWLEGWLVVSFSGMGKIEARAGLRAIVGRNQGSCFGCIKFKMSINQKEKEDEWSVAISEEVCTGQRLQSINIINKNVTRNMAKSSS